MTGTGTGNEYPEFPPGFWRRIVLYPGDGWIGSALEDDVHCFHLRIGHEAGRITSAAGRAVRHPWSGCLGAPQHLAAELQGELLADVANRDPRQQCTHMFDLAIVTAAHAGDSAPTRFDMRVADAVNGRTTATLHRNGEEALRWRMDGTIIQGPERFAGRDLKRVSQWKDEYTPEEAEWALLLRRVVYISPARQFEVPKDAVAIQSPASRHGVCFNYQPPQIESSTAIFDTRDFSTGEHEPLEDLQPELDFAKLV